MSDANVVKAVEVAAKPVLTPVTIMLNESQVAAFKKLQLLDDMQKICQNAAGTAIKGKFKYYSDKAVEQAGKAYDTVAQMGVKLDHDRASYVKKYSVEIRDILAGLE